MSKVKESRKWAPVLGAGGKQKLTTWEKEVEGRLGSVVHVNNREEVTPRYELSV